MCRSAIDDVTSWCHLQSTGSGKLHAVAPGPINTELFTVGKTPEQIQGLANMNASGRLGETEDIAGVILFLASEESQWITGQTLRVNGGFI